jgi:hypothetical protein
MSASFDQNRVHMRRIVCYIGEEANNIETINLSAADAWPFYHLGCTVCRTIRHTHILLDFTAAVCDWRRSFDRWGYADGQVDKLAADR